MEKFPYLIQRLKREDRSHMTGIDSKFAYDYMGAAEFEFGALPQALRRMRSEVDESWEIKKVKSGEQEAWVVSNRVCQQIAKTLFEDQLKPRDERKLRLKEPTYIHESYFEDYDKMSFYNIDGWWALDSDVPFALFKKKADADIWLELLKKPKP